MKSVIIFTCQYAILHFLSKVAVKLKAIESALKLLDFDLIYHSNLIEICISVIVKYFFLICFLVTYKKQ